jgi:hypothetical protein
MRAVILLLISASASAALAGVSEGGSSNFDYFYLVRQWYVGIQSASGRFAAHARASRLRHMALCLPVPASPQATSAPHICSPHLRRPATFCNDHTSTHSPPNRCASHCHARGRGPSAPLPGPQPSAPPPPPSTPNPPRTPAWHPSLPAPPQIQVHNPWHVAAANRRHMA